MSLDSLPPICLDELQRKASRLQRVDRKYLVAREDLDSILSALKLPHIDESANFSPRVSCLEIDGEREFSYSSIYFDTPAFDAYFLSSQKRRRRFKVRTRTYADSNQRFLEVKTRGSRGTNVKNRLALNTAWARSEADVLSAVYGKRRDAGFDLFDPTHRIFVEKTLADSSIVPSFVGQLHPTLETRYRRSTLYFPSRPSGGPCSPSPESLCAVNAFGSTALQSRTEKLTEGSRVTIDVDLVCTSRFGRVSFPSLAIIETKSGPHPTTLDRVLWASGYRSAKFSKYGIGLAETHPFLDPGKWRRTMRKIRPFCKRSKTDLIYPVQLINSAAVLALPRCRN